MEIVNALMNLFLDNGKFFAVICVASLVMHTIIENASRKLYGVKVMNAVKKFPHCRGTWLLFWIRVIIYCIYVISITAVLLNGIELFFTADAIEQGYYI